jgi:hypothetical protein
VQVIGIGPVDFHFDDVALPQRAARDEMNLAVDFGRIARGAANAIACPAVIDSDDLKRAGLDELGKQWS